MSKIEVNAIEPQSGTTLTLGASGDTITIPSGATINNQGSAVNFGPTGAVSWNTTKVTTGFTATAGIGYFCDTTSAAFTVTLPATPAAGAVIGIADYANTFATNNLTVGRNGSNIGGAASNAFLTTNGVSVTFVYVDATQGWIVTDSGNRSDLPGPQFVAATGGCVTTCGNFKTHVFTGPGTFTVTCAGNSGGSNLVDYLVIAAGAGGGGGPNPSYSGGGGAGGFRTTFPSPGCNAGTFPISVTAYPITVGSGGAIDGNGNTSIFSTITSAGGGAGGAGGGPVGDPGSSGGSGGGGGSSDTACETGPNAKPGGAGNTPPVAPPQGNPGGSGQHQPGVALSEGGGGGAGAAGNPGLIPATPTSGNGGIGSPIATTFFGPTAPSYGTPGPAPGRYFAGGGGGGGNISPTGGVGGGGNRSAAGTVNTGGGGGGGPGASRSGGSGIVVIRYKFQ